MGQIVSGASKDVYAQSPYRPRMRTAPVVNRAYRQDEFPTVESRLPRDAVGKILPSVVFTEEGQRVELPWDGASVRQTEEPAGLASVVAGR